MQQVDERPLETIHLYVVRENEEQKQHTMFPIVLSVICLLGIVGIGLFSANHIAYEDMTIRIPAVFLPLKQIRVEQVIVPTGIKAYPATQAHGTLTVYNGSILD